MIISLIVAMTPNRVIGKDGKIPWKHSEDMKRFKKLTMGHPIIMGRKTYDSIGRPLPGRRNIVVSRNPDLKIEGCEVYNSLDAALQACAPMDAGPFVIGGEEIYKQALNKASFLYLTYIDEEHDGDTFFPEIPGRFMVEHERTKVEGATFVTLSLPLGG